MNWEGLMIGFNSLGIETKNDFQKGNNAGQSKKHVHQSSWSLLASVEYRVDVRFNFRQPDLGSVYFMNELKLYKTGGRRWRRNGFCL